MKKLLLLSAVCFVASSVSATDLRPYIEGRISDSKAMSKVSEDDQSAKFKDTFVQGFSVETGVKMDQFRVGLEGFYNKRAHDDLVYAHTASIFGTDMSIPVEFKTKGFFLNGYWDIPMGDQFKKFKPYIGAGIGYSWLDVKMSALGTSEERKGKDWGWNVAFGTAYELNENVDLTLGYRYEDLGDFKKEGSTCKFKNHKVSLGLRYSF